MIYEIFDPIIVLIFFFIIGAFNKKHLRNAVVLLLVSVVTYVLKVLINAPRPNGGGFGFPSGHASVWGSLLLISSMEYRKFLPLVAVITTLVVFLALYFGYHYPIDILGGFMVGFAITLLLKVREWLT